MVFTYRVSEANEVSIFADDNAAVYQPISPITGKQFTSYEEAAAWAKLHIAERQSWLNAPYVPEDLSYISSSETPLPKWDPTTE